MNTMTVHTFEAAVLCHPGHAPGQAPTLDDYHRTAWRLFTGDTHYPQGERPFLFRFDVLDGDRHLLRLRSDRSFPGAHQRQQTFTAGTTRHLEWLWVPSVATRLSPSGERLPRSRHIPAPRERWESLLSERLMRHGLTAQPDRIHCLPLGRWQQRTGLAAWHEVVHVSAQLTVTDPQRAALAWLGGLSRLRTYGMGLLFQQ